MRVGPWRLFGGLAMAALLRLGPALAQDAPPPDDSPRIALVIGLGSYPAAPLPTAANDAGLVAQTLAAAGFDVTGARDLDGDHLRQAFKDFLGKAAAGGPRGIAMVYLAGHAVQVEGDNYIVPVDATLAREADVAIESLRLTDFTRALAATNLGAKVVVVDGAHADAAGPKIFATGLALVDPDPGSLLAFNAAPGTAAPIDQGAFGPYAAALVRMMKQGGVPVDEVFARLRVAVNTDTRGAQVPWSVSKVVTSFTFFDRGADAPALSGAQIPFASLRSRPLREFSAEQAYDIAIARDSLPAYQDYLTAFPDNPLSRRIKVLLAGRREALFWRSVLRAHSAPALWTYLQRYPRGPHGAEAERRLTRLAEARSPPPGFAPLTFDVPPPPEDEMAIVEQRFVLSGSDLPPPPQPPVFLMPPPGAGEGQLPTPGPVEGAGFLPIPLALAIPFVRPILAPGFIRPPRQFTGSYRQPRPFGWSPDNRRLVPQPLDDGRPIRGTLSPAPVTPVPKPPRSPALPSGPALPVVPQVRQPGFGAGTPDMPLPDRGQKPGRGLKPDRGQPLKPGRMQPGQGAGDDPAVQRPRRDPADTIQSVRPRPDPLGGRRPRLPATGGDQPPPTIRPQRTLPAGPDIRPSRRPDPVARPDLPFRPRPEPRFRAPDPLIRPAPAFRTDPPAFRQQPPAFRSQPLGGAGQQPGGFPRNGAGQGGFGGGGGGGGVRPQPMSGGRANCGGAGQIPCR